MASSQYKRYAGILKSLEGPMSLEDLRGAHACLAHLCDTAQNPKDNGGLSDESIGPETYVDLRKLEQSLFKFLWNLDIARNRSNKESA